MPMTSELTQGAKNLEGQLVAHRTAYLYHHPGLGPWDQSPPKYFERVLHSAFCGRDNRAGHDHSLLDEKGKAHMACVRYGSQEHPRRPVEEKIRIVRAKGPPGMQNPI